MSSDSCTSPLLVNSPVTVQSALRKCSTLPGVRPRNCLAAPTPATSSRTAGRNMRPSTMVSSGRTWPSVRPTPRRVMLASVPVSIFGTFTTVTSSFDSAALPAESLAMSGALPMVSTSVRVRLLLSSASEPPRRMMARSARPLSASVCRKPTPMASTEISTATTPAIPMTMTLEAPTRCGSVCRLMTLTAQSCLNTSPSSALVGQCIDDVEPHGAERRRDADDQRQQYRHADTGQYCPRRNVDALQPQFENGQRAEAQRQSDQRCRHAEQQRFRDHQPENGGVAEAQGLEHGEFRDAFAHGLDHGVAGEEQQSEKNRSQDGAQHEPDVAELLDEGHGEFPGRLRLGLVGGVREQRIDAIGNRH